MENLVATNRRTLHSLVTTDTLYDEFLERLDDPNVSSDMGYSLLHAAAYSSENNSRIVRLLLERGANLESTTLYGRTPLHFAVASRKRDAVVAFMEAGANVNCKDFLGRTVLHFAIGSRWSHPPIPDLNNPCDMWIVDRLLQHPDIAVNIVDNAGNTPLMWAVVKRYSHAVKKLLKMGANPNIPNTIDRTPLHKAISSRDPNAQIVFALLKNGAGIYCKDRTGKTPIDILVRNASGDEISLFAKHVVWLIALRYHVNESLQQTLKKIPYLYEHFEICYKEVELMMKQIIYDNFTLHDFVLNCYQSRFFDVEQDASTPVIKLLLSGSYVQYLNFILERM